MAQIYDDVIRFNGINLFQRYGLMSVHIKQSEERIFGIKRSMEFQDGVGNPIFIKNKDERMTFQVELCKVARDEPTSITEEELEEIGRTLFVEGISCMESQGRLYYGAFTGSESWFNSAKQGYLNLTFEMATPYPYSRVYIDSINVDGVKEIEVYNKSSVKGNLYIDMEFKQLGESGSLIEIRNKTNGNEMIFRNIDKNEVIQVDGEDALEIRSITNKDKNIFNDLDYNSFIKIRYGRNIIQIKGKCKMNIKYQLPLIMK